MMQKVLTIAGSDTSGGAGIQADLKTFQELNVYGMTALTTIVTMSPENWQHQVFPIDLDVLESQLKTAFSVGIDALKTGMLGSVDVIELAASYIDKHDMKRVVIDPVMVCKGENEVLHPETADALREVLVKHALVVTPNLFEASQLAQSAPIKTLDDMKEAAAAIYEKGTKYVLIKGGKQLEHEKAVDLLFDGKNYHLFEAEKVDTMFNHGAGCTYAAAITAELAKGRTVEDAVGLAKQFISKAVRHGFRLNDFVGPVMHAAHRRF